MDVRQSVFGEIAIHSGADVSGIEVATLLRRMLLFESVVIKSVRLREVPHLVRLFGPDGLLLLINSGVLKLSCELIFLVGDVKTNGVRQLPLFHFDFGVANLANREDMLNKELRSLQGISGLKNVQRTLVENTILEKITRPPADYGSEFLAQTKSDLRNNSPALMFALKEQLKQRNIQVDNPTIRVEEAQGVFRVISNLPSWVGVSDEVAHEILWLSIQAVGNINQRIADMSAYSSITGFAESEAPLLFGKFAGLLAPQNPNLIEEQFVRVLSLAEFPDIDETRRIDVQKLLKARESPELREFRTWLSKLDSVSDQQISEMIGCIRSKLGSLFQTSTAKGVRFAVTNGLGLIPGAGLVIGPVASAIDSFLIDRVFPTSGVVAFLSRTYPSLFISGEQ
jgi:hypothetical protein